MIKEKFKTFFSNQENKKITLFSVLIFLSWPLLFLISFFLSDYQKVSNPSLWYFTFPISYLVFGIFLSLKKPKFPYLKKINADFPFYFLLIVNFLWSIHVSMQHHSSLNGYFLVFTLSLVQLFQSTTGLYNAKKTLLSGSFQIATFVLSYVFIYQNIISIDDIVAIHTLWISILFFSFLNETITRSLKEFKKYNLT